MTIKRGQVEPHNNPLQPPAGGRCGAKLTMTCARRG